MTKHGGTLLPAVRLPRHPVQHVRRRCIHLHVLRWAPLCGRHPTRFPQSPADSSPAQATAAPLPTATATGGTPPPCAFPSTMTLSAGWGCSLPGSTRTGVLYCNQNFCRLPPPHPGWQIRCRQPAAGMDAAELQKAGHGFQHRRGQQPGSWQSTRTAAAGGAPPVQSRANGSAWTLAKRVMSAPFR